MIVPSTSSRRSLPQLEGPAIVVVDAECVAPAIVGLEESAASDSGVSCLRRMSTIPASSGCRRSPLLSTLLDMSFVFRSTAVTLVPIRSTLVSILLFPSSICLMGASIHPEEEGPWAPFLSGHLLVLSSTWPWSTNIRFVGPDSPVLKSSSRDRRQSCSTVEVSSAPPSCDAKH